MAKTETYYCASCGKPFVALISKRLKGWAKFCSIRCKAIKQVTSRYRKSSNETEDYEYEEDYKSKL